MRALVDGQRGALFPWVPVFLGTGIGLYFALRAEPPGLLLLAAAAGALALAGLARLWRAGAGPLLLAPALVLAGLALAGARAHSVAAPVLDFRYYGPLEGRITGVDRSASGAVRLVLDRVVLDGVPPDRTPRRVRVSLHGDQRWLEPSPGMTVILTASLSPPAMPAAPGAFDFRRIAWFQQIGALGYTRSPALMLEPPSGVWLARLRHDLARGIHAHLPGDAGGFAAAILAGDESGLSERALEEMRASNLVHILSISGLHMVLLCGAVFWALRLGLALVPGLALRHPVRKWAAAGALAAGFLYYLLSGRAVPAERAWVMIAVVMGAVIVDRRAISVRSLAVAALAVLLLRPESLAEAGFQMSFAATLVLVTVYGEMQRHVLRLPRWTHGPGGALLSSMLAGAATAPFVAAHFNRLSDYGVAANLAAMPLMGLAVMPLAVVWMVALPFGLSGPVLWLMGWPIRGVLGISAVAAALPGAVSMAVAPGAAVLPLLGFGGLVLALWRGPLRLAGAAVMALALVLWARAERPALLVSAGGGLVGLMTPEGRALSKPAGQGFEAESWLEDDGDAATQAEAAARPGMERRPGEVRLTLAGLRIVQITGRDAAARAAAACATADLVITTAKAASAGCVIWDAALLERSGTVALRAGAGGLRLATAAAESNGRLWSPAPVPDLRLPAGGAAAEGR